MAGWILGGLVALGLVVFIMREINKQQRWDAIFNALSATLGGQRLDSAMILRWLNTYWAGPFSPSDIQLGPCGGAVAAVLDGFPALMSGGRPAEAM